EIGIWTAFFLPAGTPPAVVKRLQEEVARVVRLPDIRERLNDLGVEPVGGTSEELARRVASDIERWSAVAKAGNIRSD
ncbi:MAG TPA: tripartite tricarboxylate transporter substrate-binding protein, partial [Burkholderiales bacterium]|nr:tripartite tricarboxylate transporter substrate-binding protein [Burkholderiales bacterium]